MFCACCEGVFPAVNLFSKWVPTTWEMHRDADDGQDPQDQDRPAAVVAGAGQAAQRCHLSGAASAVIDVAHGRFAIRFIIDEL